MSRDDSAPAAPSLDLQQLDLHQQLDLQGAADELGVHYQTAYRWVRSGRLPARRLRGKYVVDRADLADLERDRSTPESVPVPSSARLGRSADRLHQLLVDGDEAMARMLIRRLTDDGTPIVDLVQHVLVPPLQSIGEAWHRGELSIWVEHRSSAIVERALGDIVPNPRGRRRGTVVVGALTGDQHALPTTMAAAALRADQWHVHHLGADVPVAEFVAACTENDADLAVVTVTNPALCDAAERAAAVLTEAGVENIVGAPGRRLDELIELARAAASARRS
jgi:excisionase family DNA binding protein